MQDIHVGYLVIGHHIRTQPLKDRLGLTGRASVRLFDLHCLASLLFPLFGKQLVISREQFTGNVVGGVEQLLVGSLYMADGKTCAQHQRTTPTAGSLEQGKVSCHTSSDNRM